MAVISMRLRMQGTPALLAALLMSTCVLRSTSAHENSATNPAAAEGLPDAWSALSLSEFECAPEMGGKQPAVTLATDRDGRLVTAWIRPRARDGQTGVLARVHDQTGRALTDPVRLSDFGLPVQTQPTLAVDAGGNIWAAWNTAGQSGPGRAVEVRCFSAGLAQPLTTELVVSDAGVNGSPVLVAGKHGGALVVWESAESLSSAHSVIRGCIFPGPTSDGRTLFAIPSDDAAQSLLPTAAALPDGDYLLAWAERSGDSSPSQIRAQRIDSHATLEGSRIDVSGPCAADQIEPSMTALADGRCVVAWLGRAGSGYDVLWRMLDSDGSAQDSVRIASPASTGWNSAPALAAAADGGFVLAFNCDSPTVGDRGEVYALRFDANAHALDVSPVRINGCTKGPQGLNPATGAARIACLPNGSLAFAWTGHYEVPQAESDPDDHRAENIRACISIWRPFSAAPVASSPALGESATAAQIATLTGMQPDLLAERQAPIPPLRNPEWTPQEPYQYPAEGPDFGFEGVPGTVWFPPDPALAVGPKHIVLMTNGQIAFFDKDGTNTFRQKIEDANGFWGAQGATNFVFDPEVIFDPHSGRFMAMACERAGAFNPKSLYLLAVSDDADPNGIWYKYRIDVTSLCGDGDIDSPNLAADANTIWLSSDHFTPDAYLVYAIDKASVLNGGTPAAASELITGSHSFGMPVTYDPDAPAQYLIESTENDSNTRIILHAITNPQTNWARTRVAVQVPAYTFPAQPPQKGTSSRPYLFEPRFWSCVYRNGSLWACHHVNSVKARVRWYEFALNGWPASGQNPTVRQWGEIDPGGDIATYFCSIAVDDAGNAAITYARSSPDEYISMGRSLRRASDPLGAFLPGEITRESYGYSTGGRWGDYCGTQPDPVEADVFWGHHEWTDRNTSSGWRTWVARYVLPSRLTLTVDPLWAGQEGAMRIAMGDPNAPVYFCGSWDGPGSTFVPQLNVALDMAHPQLLAQAVTDATGAAEVRRQIPPSQRNRVIWLQAAQVNLKSNVVLTQIN